jgi:hypothetical protein
MVPLKEKFKDLLGGSLMWDGPLKGEIRGFVWCVHGGKEECGRDGKKRLEDKF